MKHQRIYDQEVKCENSQTPIAVVGLACRLPGGCNTAVDFWSFLLEGGCASCDVPSSRFSVEQFYDGSLRPNTMRSPGGMFLSIDPKDLDAGFFGLSQAEAISMDPNQRQLLEVVYEGLESAGIKLEHLKKKRYGCFVGSYASDITGPRYLDSGDADGAIVAGCNLYLNPEHNMEQSAMDAAASRTGRCWTFDARADGYIKAEAINTIILKRLGDAVRDGDPIRAVIRGSSTNSDGWTPGIANPSPDAQALAIKRAYARAGISQLSETAYLECHGTGTLAGDPIEVTAASAVFAPGRPSPLQIGSVKSNIGHSEPAAGISGMLKTILSIENGVIPGNPTFEVPNPNINFTKLKVAPSRTATEWPLNMIKRASVNSFGYGGSNAHVVIEHRDVLIPEMTTPHISSYRSGGEYFLELENKEHSDRQRLFVFSANDVASLRDLTKSYVRHLANPAVSIDPNDLAYTLSERRTRHFHRAFAASYGTDLRAGQFSYGKLRPTPPRIGFVFTGQGAQWSEMGKELLEAFDVALSTVKRLEKALESLKDPPPWSLRNELVQRRTTEHIRSPEFSQPLVTALQLALFDVLSELGIKPNMVIGHSSGEIAAAAVSGRLTYEEAIKVAYFRGKVCTVSSGMNLGMLAVGLSDNDVGLYTRDVPSIQVACLNSPASVTLSGEVPDLERVQNLVHADGHFARLLHVDMAYHSSYMQNIANEYLSVLGDNCPALGSHTSPCTVDEPAFFSTVSGERIDRRTDADYWRDNMVCSVQFSKALQSLITEEAPDTLVELGPSNTLAGPISQIKDHVESRTTPVEYFALLSRKSGPIEPLYELIGKMFLDGVDIDLMRANNINATDHLKVITDLPNYAWNHSVKYWHEPLASIDWRFRKFRIHDLLGTKIIGTSWQMPSWKRTIRLKELPWLRDHRISSTVVFPAAGYIAMAVEAIFQTGLSIGLLKDINDVSDATYDLRNVRLLRALLLDEDREFHLYLFLTPTHNSDSTWFQFNIQHLRNGTWTKHADGTIRARCNTEPQLCATQYLAAFENPIGSKIWYRALDKVGFNFGPRFQNLLEYETWPGAETNRARLAWSQQEDMLKESCYPIHPTTIDAFFQAGCPSVYRYRTAVDRVIVPKVIEDITICSHRKQPLQAIAMSRSTYNGSGRRDSIPNHASHTEIYDSQTGQLIFKLAGLTYSEIEAPVEFGAAHDYINLSWRPDMSTFQDTPLELLPVIDEDPTPFSIALDCSKPVAQMLLLTKHKLGLLSLLDIDFASEDSEICSQLRSREIAEDATFSRYVYVSTSTQGLKRAEARMGSELCSSFFIHNILSDQETPFINQPKFDVVVVRFSFTAATNLASLLARASSFATDKGYVILVQPDILSENLISTSKFSGSASNDESIESIISMAGLQLHLRSTKASTETDAFLCSKHSPDSRERKAMPCSILHLSHQSNEKQLRALEEGLRHKEIFGRLVSMEQAIDQPAGDPILLLDHPEAPFLETIDQKRWSQLQAILGSNCRVLYLSCGQQEGVLLPGASMFTGLARTIRSEDPTVMIKTLESSSSSIKDIIPVISLILERFSDVHENSEHEFREHKGVLYVSRLYKDHTLIDAETQAAKDRPMQKKQLHANNRTVRMRCSRIGTLDSLDYFEVDDRESELREDCIEVEIRAAALNFKDIATSMGLVSEDECKLGSDGAGIVRRVGDKVTGFNEGATIPIVFFTVVYALLETTKVKRGQTILIHSAAGGVGIASIQLCRYLGAKIYATVGTDDKRQFLADRYGLSPDAIFSSRSIEFHQKVMEATDGRGVDIVLNSLSGDLLAESWRCLADNGTLIELGKKDIVDGTSLSMKPFNKNCTYRAIDIAHPSIYFDFDLFTRCMSTISLLLEAGFIEPIQPRKILSFGQISKAMKYMRKGIHIGKIVFSDHGQDIEVPVEPATPTLQLERDSAYLLIGGLKGLCGSLAVFLAQYGAGELVIMSRSGTDDDESRAVIRNVTAMGTRITVVKGDVTIEDDVARAFRSAQHSIRGIIQGAMVLRCSDYHAVTAAKCKPLQFFTLLSSISGIVGSGGQANYAAGNAFLDAFASYRHNLGLCAHSIDLGVIDEVGYLSKHIKTAERVETRSGLAGIDERTLHKIVKMSILQQSEPLGTQSRTQTVTGLLLPLRRGSELFRDARFCTLRLAHDDEHLVTTKGANSILALFQQMFQANIDAKTIQMEVVRFISDQAVKVLGIAEAIEPAKSLSSYGIDSLAAVDLRNWLRTQLNIDMSTLDILHAKSLLDLAEKAMGSLRNLG
ncbi:hypothetical protein N0V90_012536 [Kalmusia sp. IMI 367209]|nr:hypothetical protein N0V90_012536 [Kalmusia sp. IMI 367209]